MASRHVCRAFASGVLVLVIAPGVAQAQTFNALPIVTEIPRANVAPAPPKVPAPAGFRWSGFYLGGTVGYGGGKGDTTFALVPGGGGIVPDGVQPDNTGWTYGFYGGINHQGGIFVAGAEADILFSNMDGSQQATNFTFNGVTVEGTMSAAQKISWLSSIRGRAGVDIAGYLLYGTAGFGIEHLHHASNITTPTQFPVDQTDTQYGWNVGGGFESRVTDHIMLRAQYLHFDFGSTTANATPVQGTSQFTVDHTWISTSNVFSGGITFKF